MALLKISQAKFIESTMSYPKGIGYVLDFSDRTIAEYFQDEFKIDFFDTVYEGRGTSKRNRLLSLIENSPTHLSTKILRALWERREGLIRRSGDTLDALQETQNKLDYMAMLVDLEAKASAISTDALQAFDQNRTLDELIADIERTLQANKPEVAIDHLHTYCVKKITYLLEQRSIKCDESESLQARFGKYRKAIVSEFQLTEFTDRALKTTISLFEAFNDLRNHRSLAHDTTLLEPNEARYVVENINSALRLVRSLEAMKYGS